MSGEELEEPVVTQSFFRRLTSSKVVLSVRKKCINIMKKMAFSLSHGDAQTSKFYAPHLHYLIHFKLKNSH